MLSLAGRVRDRLRGVPALQPARRVLAFGRRYARALRHPPVLVYQVGKVGSTSVYESLRGAGMENAVHHVHYLSAEGLAHSEANHRLAGWAEPPQHLRDGRQLERDMRHFPGVRFKVIALVREHIGFEVSRMFEAAEARLEPDVLDAHGRVDTGAMLARLQDNLARHDEADCYYCRWFARELPAVFGLELLAEPFEPARGYATYRAPRADIALIRMEDLDRVFPAVAAALLGRDELALSRRNERSETADAETYGRVKRELQLPAAVARAVHGCRVSRHFYAPAELEAAVQRWSNPR